MNCEPSLCFLFEYSILECSIPSGYGILICSLCSCAVSVLLCVCVYVLACVYGNIWMVWPQGEDILYILIYCWVLLWVNLVVRRVCFNISFSKEISKMLKMIYLSDTNIQRMIASFWVCLKTLWNRKCCSYL